MKAVIPVTEQQSRKALPEQTLQEVIDSFEGRGPTLALVQFMKDGTKQYSYERLLEQIRSLSAGLGELGIEKGDTVVLLAANSPQWVMTALAVFYAGAVIVPVDPQVNDETIAHIISDSKAKIAFADSKSAERLNKVKHGSKFQIMSFEEDNKEWSNLFETAKKDPTRVAPDDTAILFYTSGTTGMPKGVPLTHLNIAFQLDSVKKTGLLTPTDRFLQPLPMFHVYPFVIGLLSPLFLGLPVIFPYSMTGPEIAQALQEGRATVLIAVPKLLRAIYNALESKVEAKGAFAQKVFQTGLKLTGALKKVGLKAGKTVFKEVHNKFSPSLRLLCCGGATLDPELNFNLNALGWDIAIGYGLTETSPLLCIRKPGNSDLQSVGPPIPGVQIRIDKSVHPGDEADSSNADLGEVQAKGPSVFTHYLHLEEKSKESFTDDGWFKTGDQGYMHNGNVRITGRIATMIVSEGGQNIQPEDVEDNFSKEPLLKEIAVLQKDRKLVALVVPKLDASEKDTDALKGKISEALRSRGKSLPSYYQVTDIALTREPLPRTNLGKLKRHLLEERYDQAEKSKLANGSKAGAAMTYEQMSTDDQVLLDQESARQTWDLLVERYPDKELSMDSSPQMDLGVDSLEWLDLSLELSERTGVELDEEQIAQVETVRDLIRLIGESHSKTGSGGTPVSPLDQPEKFLDADQETWLEPLSPQMERNARFLYNTNRFLMRTFFHVRAEGLEKLVDRQYVFTPNHSSYLDAFAVAAVMDYDCLSHAHWAGWAGIAFNNPWNTFIYRLARVIPIDAKKALNSSLAYGAAVLMSGKNLFWFPEGDRTPDGELLPFKPGIGMLLNKFRVAAVPVHLQGTRRALPPGAVWPKFGQITVRFGDPVFASQLQKEGEGKTDYEKVTNGLRNRVQRLKDSQ